MDPVPAEPHRSAGDEQREGEMHGAVIPWRCFGNESVAELTLAFLFAAVPALVLEYHVHVVLPPCVPSVGRPLNGDCGRAYSGQGLVGLRCAAEDLSFWMIFCVPTHTGRQQSGLSSSPWTVRRTGFAREKRGWFGEPKIMTKALSILRGRFGRVALLDMDT